MIDVGSANHFPWAWKIIVAKDPFIGNSGAQGLEDGNCHHFFFTVEYFYVFVFNLVRKLINSVFSSCAIMG